MAETVLGIDLREESVRMVALNRTLKGHTVVGAAGEAVPAGSGEDIYAEAAGRVAAASGLLSDTVVVGFGSEEALFRRLRFPFSSAQKIRQVIAFEMEPELPMEAGEALVSFRKAGPADKDGSQEVLAAALPRNVLPPLLTSFQQAGLDPEICDVQAGGLAALARHCAAEAHERTLWLDVGETRTTMLLTANGEPLVARAVPYGLSDMAAAGARAAGMAPEEAKARLAGIDLSSLEAGGDAALRGEAVRVVESLVREVTLTIVGARRDEEAIAPGLVVVSGEGAALPGLTRLFESLFEAGVKAVTELECYAPRAAALPEGEDPAAYAVAYGLALRRGLEGSGFNFRVGEFASTRIRVDWRRHLPYAAACFAAVLLAWGVATVSDIQLKKARLEKIRAEMTTIFRRTLPDAPKNVQPSQYANVLLQRVDTLRQSALFIGPESVDHSMSELLSRISRAIGPDLKIVITLLTVDDRSVRILARADTFNTVEAVKNRLTGLQGLSDVQIRGAKAAQSGQGVEFSIEANRS